MQKTTSQIVKEDIDCTSPARHPLIPVRGRWRNHLQTRSGPADSPEPTGPAPDTTPSASRHDQLPSSIADSGRTPGCEPAGPTRNTRTTLRQPTLHPTAAPSPPHRCGPPSIPSPPSRSTLTSCLLESPAPAWGLATRRCIPVAAAAVTLSPVRETIVLIVQRLPMPTPALLLCHCLLSSKHPAITPISAIRPSSPALHAGAQWRRPRQCSHSKRCVSQHYFPAEHERHGTRTPDGPSTDARQPLRPPDFTECPPECAPHSITPPQKPRGCHHTRNTNRLGTQNHSLNSMIRTTYADRFRSSPRGRERRTS